MNNKPEIEPPFSLEQELILNDDLISNIDPEIIFQLLVWKNSEAAAILIKSLVNWGLEKRYIKDENGKIELVNE